MVQHEQKLLDALAVDLGKPPLEWADYPYGERRYIVSSLIAKSATVGQTSPQRSPLIDPRYEGRSTLPA